MKLSQLTTIKVGMENADFWLIRQHDKEKVGKPTKTYNKDYIGIKVARTDLLIPEYLFYLLEYLYLNKYWELLSKGSLKRQHILIQDVKNIEIQKASESKEEEKDTFTFEQFADIQKNMPKADFWIKSQGEDRGKPTNIYTSNDIGIKIKIDFIPKGMLFFFLDEVWKEGIYKNSPKILSEKDIKSLEFWK